VVALRITRFPGSTDPLVAVQSPSCRRVENGEAAYPTSPSSTHAESILSSAVLDCSLDRYDAESKRNLTDVIVQGVALDARIETDPEVIVLATGLRERDRT
jgi:transcription initiation factor TFIID subunit TAF12